MRWRIPHGVVIWSLLCGPDSAADDKTTLAMLQAAVRQHEANCQSGCMEFKRTRHQLEGNQLSTLEGYLEWDSEEYLHFDGTFHEEYPTSHGRRVARDGLKILQTMRGVVIRVEGWAEYPDSVPSRRTDRLMYYRLPEFKGTAVERYWPDPKELLISCQVLGFRSPELCLRVSAADGRLPLARTVVRDPETGKYEVACKLGRTTETWNTFDLHKGGLCDSYKIVRSGGSRTAYEEMTRTWTQGHSGGWYPASSTSISRWDSWTAEPRCVADLTITAFKPLKKRRISGHPGLNTFGPIPPGASIVERNAEGKLVTRDTGPDREPDFEERLKALAKGLRGTGPQSPAKPDNK